MPDQLVFRVDGGTRIGTGHVMRCLNLADYWKDENGSSVFLMSESSPALDRRIAANGWKKIQLAAPIGSQDDALGTAQQGHAVGFDWIVADGYQFGTEWQESVIASGSRLLLLDDFGHARRYVAHLVLNQNLQAPEDLYRNRAPWTKLLTGNRYVIIARQFLSWTDWRRVHPPIGKKVLITFGGSDPQNITCFILRAFEQVSDSDYELRILIGGSNTHTSEIESAALRCGQSCQLLYDVGDMGMHMAWADWALVGGGTTCWEVAFMQLPALAISCAHQEDLLLDSLASRQVLQKIGNIKACTVSALVDVLNAMPKNRNVRESMGRRGRELVDGRGASRVIDAIRGSSRC
jgi:UDP-2,4-diacetamido-2,4,6-trideoxy-beta-L-altropyranose hydrolase